MTVEAGSHFGHMHLTLRVEGRPTVVISLSDPQGMRELAEQMVRIACDDRPGKEDV